MALSDDSFSGDDDYAAVGVTLPLDFMEDVAPREFAARRAILSVVPAADRHTVEQLLSLFVLRTDKYDSSPLHLAVSDIEAFGDTRLEVCQALLTAGADPNDGSRKQSPLHLATERGDDEAVRMLIDAGLDPPADQEKTDTHRCTPLLRACDTGHETVARTLIDAGANTDARECTLQSTPIHVAATKGHVGVVLALLQHGVLHNISLHNATDRHGQSPLYVAAGNDVFLEEHEAVVRALIDVGADANQRTHAGSTPLHGAAYYGHASVVKSYTLHPTPRTLHPTSRA